MTKFTSKLMPVGAGCLALVALGGPAASATDLLPFETTSITAANPTQLGRISRNSVQQTWDPADDGETSYPGAINTTTAYNYTTFTFTPAEIGNGQFVQIDISEPNAADLFASAWTSYNGTSSVQSGSGWLGDAGQSEDYAFTSIPPTPQDSRFFNVTVPAGDSLTVVVNTTSATALGENFGIEVEDFSDTEYDPATPAAVPEPSTWAILGASALLGGLAMFRRRKQAV